MVALARRGRSTRLERRALDRWTCFQVRPSTLLDRASTFDELTDVMARPDRRPVRAICHT